MRGTSEKFWERSTCVEGFPYCFSCVLKLRTEMGRSNDNNNNNNQKNISSVT